MVVVCPTLSLACRLVFASLMPAPPDLAGALTVPERAATSPPKILSHFWTDSDTKPESISRSCWMPRNLRRSSPHGLPQAPCFELIVPAHVVRRQLPYRRDLRNLRPGERLTARSWGLQLPRNGDLFEPLQWMIQNTLK